MTTLAPHKILMLEDNPASAELIEHQLRRHHIPFVSQRVDTRNGFLDALQRFAPDLILSDYRLVNFDGFEALALAKQHRPHIPFILVTGSLSEETAVDCMKAGAADYVLKEHLVRLGPAVQGALDMKSAQEGKKKIEEQLQLTIADLARSNAELERFAYIASHDLQEPLRTVNSYVQLLERRYGNTLDRDAHEFIQYAVQGVNRMRALILGLLEYSRIGRHEQPVRRTDAQAVLKQTLANLEIALQEKQGIVTTEGLPEVLSDPVLLSEVFQNLIGNAIKFCEKPPRIHIKACPDGERWLFSIKDNGIGMDPQHWERIFEIFQRLHPAQEYPGTGLGLAICKKIIERQGGRIWVESQPGEGSTFLFSLPKA